MLRTLVANKMVRRKNKRNAFFSTPFTKVQAEGQMFNPQELANLAPISISILHLLKRISCMLIFAQHFTIKSI